jgi:hypothetical protein
VVEAECEDEATAEQPSHLVNMTEQCICSAHACKKLHVTYSTPLPRYVHLD